MAKSCSAECEHDQLPFRAAEVDFDNLLKSTLKNDTRRHAAEAGFKQKLGCYVFCATGITAYLEASGTLEDAQAMAAHESPRTTKLYDRTGDEITLDEVERITI